MSYEDVLLETADGVGTITLNRPDKLNAFAGRMRQEMAAAVGAMAHHELILFLLDLRA